MMHPLPFRPVLALAAAPTPVICWAGGFGAPTNTPKTVMPTICWPGTGDPTTSPLTPSPAIVGPDFGSQVPAGSQAITGAAGIAGGYLGSPVPTGAVA